MRFDISTDAPLCSEFRDGSLEKHVRRASSTPATSASVCASRISKPWADLSQYAARMMSNLLARSSCRAGRGSRSTKWEKIQQTSSYCSQVTRLYNRLTHSCFCVTHGWKIPSSPSRKCKRVLDILRLLQGSEKILIPISWTLLQGSSNNRTDWETPTASKNQSYNENGKSQINN